MNIKKTLFVISAIAAASQIQAGGILTNTNQSIAFLRNPARDAAIGIDGVYSNPAGVAFLKDGWHFGINWQCAVQTRTVTETSPYLDRTLSILKGTPEQREQNYRGHATAPIIPSVQAAYNKGPWSFQFNFAVSGGGGKCQYENGLGAFEGQIGQIACLLNQKLDPTLNGYSVDCYMEGRQYYYGVTLGAAYKVTPNLSVYAGLRGLIASASYTARIQNIEVSNATGMQHFSSYIEKYINPAITTLSTSMKQIEAAGLTQTEPYATKYATANANYATLTTLSSYGQGIDLTSDQTGFGIAPLVGVDWQVGRFNLAAKYEFRTKMSLKNSSNLPVSTMTATSQYQDGTSVREDSPALLTLGIQYSPVDIVRLNVGYHHFYDQDAPKTYFYQEDPTSLTSPIIRSDEKNKMLSSGTNEYLGGIEVDCTDRLIVSAGAQITRYGMTDDYMSDQSFVTNSWTFGFGASYQANPNVKIEAAYFKTLYDHYTTTPSSIGEFKDFTRTNDVIGVGLVIDL